MVNPSLLALWDARVIFPDDFNTNMLMLLRWIHFLAGITWVGLLYFFNLVNVPFLKGLDGDTKNKIVPLLMPRALWWFRWASVVTVLAGIAYWMVIIASDRRNGVNVGYVDATSGTVIGSFFALWTLAFVIEMGALMAPPEVLRKGPVLAAIVAVAVIAAGWMFVGMNSHGWESSRLLAIGVGGGLGWFMMLNVWGLIWRMQKKMIGWARQVNSGNPLSKETAREAAKVARLAFLASRVNAFLSIPMLFFMGAASHYPMFGGWQ
jgi:uncharacterized membrane protein